MIIMICNLLSYACVAARANITYRLLLSHIWQSSGCGHFLLIYKLFYLYNPLVKTTPIAKKCSTNKNKC